MAVSIRSYSCKVVPAIQVVSNLNRKNLLLHSYFQNSRHSIAGATSRSVFLNQFLSKRGIGSISSIRAFEDNQIIENQIELKPNSNYSNNWEQASFCLNLRVDSFQPFLPVTNESACNKGTPLTQNRLREIYSLNGHSQSSVSFGVTSNPFISDYERQMILLSESIKEPTPEPPKHGSGKPTAEHLHVVHEVLSKTLPKLFIQPLDYSIYHPNLIFENNIRGTRTVGLFHYVRQIALLRMIGHFKFAYVKFDILKITSHPEDGSVKVRWRIKGISGMKVFFNFWKFSILNMKESIEREQESWYDGFSVFFVDGEGKVFKHVVDKMQPDPEEKTETVKPTLATKLALMLGLTPLDCLDYPHVITALRESSRCLSDAMLPLDQIE
uniref:Uncharacterized protein n=1 Tax=Graphocephala atropunctata TaxID=36148 RepID=A0A1B6KL10_9HEMI